MRSQTVAQIRAVLSGVPESAGMPAFQMYPGDRVELARQAHVSTGHDFRVDPSTIAFSLGLVVAFGGAAGCSELTDGTQISFVWSPLRRTRGIRLLHAIAHALLRRHGWAHSESDVWLVTLELAAPSRELRRLGVGGVARHAHAPEWLVREWADVALRLGSSRATG